MSLNPEQQQAVDARGLVFVSAGAGTGKTKVLVERFARAVCDEGIDVESILVITYTEKAAGELRSRIRAGLVERGRPDLARELAVGIVERIRTGDVKHDPKGGDCPTWCELWSMCRIKRA